ncbi:MAG: exodeoxyribonuclease VII large subunit, partial [Clostridia bacterium]|nr:exodeoxyribonuclease VII large subunit [Clostridia bacterium]
DGMKVTVKGRVTLYERDGQFQINVTEVIEDGFGLLYVKLEELKRKLQAEGLFDEAHKKPIPRFVKKIGVATSPTGAVFRDIINVATRRCPGISILLAPVKVQGDDAPRSIVTGIKALDECDDIDVIIVGRGGGSVEELFCFNDEEVARTIYNCKKPIISAVGHETDFTIADFVADLRAPTPSAAAELAVFDYYDTLLDIEYFEKTLVSDIDERLESKRFIVNSYSRSFEDPMRIVDNYSNKLTRLVDLLDNAISQHDKEKRFLQLTARLDALSPLKVLARGYSVVSKNGKVINSSAGLNNGDNITVRFSKGEIKAEVIENEKH